MPPEFSLHLFFLDMLVLVTPAAIIGVCLFIKKFSSYRKVEASWHGIPQGQTERLFLLVFWAVPVLAFALYSLRHEAKLNWSGPAFIVLLPFLAQQMHMLSQGGGSRFGDLISLLWKITIPFVFAGGFVVLHYLSFGFPYVPYSSKMVRWIGWRSLADKIVDVVQEVEKESGKRPIVVGMDKHNVASEIAFYWEAEAARNGGVPGSVMGRCFFGLECLMFNFWDAGKDIQGKDMVLVSRRIGDLSDQILAQRFTAISPAHEIRTERNGKPVGTYYYRVGKAFR